MKESATVEPAIHDQNSPVVKFHQLFALPQPSQGNIYLFSPLKLQQTLGYSSFLFSTLNGKFTLASFAKPRDYDGNSGHGLPWEPHLKDVFFAEIGNNVHRDRTIEVFSLHIYQRKSGNQIFIAIAFAVARKAFDPASLIRTRTSTANRNELVTPNPSVFQGMSVPLSPGRSDSLTGESTTISDETAAQPLIGIKSSPARPDSSGGPHSSSISGSSVTHDSNYIHIYASGLSQKEDDAESQFSAATANLLYRQSLSFTPTHLTSLPEERSFDRPTFLLGGSDSRVHVFAHVSRLEFTDEIPAFVRVSDTDSPLASLFPEFINKQQHNNNESCPVVTWIDYFINKETENKGIGVSAVGYRDGNLVISLVDIDYDVESVNLKSSLVLSHFGPILSLRLFGPPQGNELSILVCASLEPCLVYSLTFCDRAALTVKQVCELPVPSHSLPTPIPLSALVADINFDNHAEIIIGFCDKSILVYKHAQLRAVDVVDLQWTLCTEYSQALSHHSPGPILAMYYGPLLQHSPDKDNKTALIQQALSYFVCLTTNGLLVLQHDLQAAMNLCKERLKNSPAAIENENSVV